MAVFMADSVQVASPVWIEPASQTGFSNGLQTSGGKNLTTILAETGGGDGGPAYFPAGGDATSPTSDISKSPAIGGDSPISVYGDSPVSVYGDSPVSVHGSGSTNPVPGAGSTSPDVGGTTSQPNLSGQPSSPNFVSPATAPASGTDDGQATATGNIGLPHSGNIGVSTQHEPSEYSDTVDTSGAVILILAIAASAISIFLWYESRRLFEHLTKLASAEDNNKAGIESNIIFYSSIAASFIWIAHLIRLRHYKTIFDLFSGFLYRPRDYIFPLLLAGIVPLAMALIRFYFTIPAARSAFVTGHSTVGAGIQPAKTHFPIFLAVIAFLADLAVIADYIGFRIAGN